ncbi:acyl-CoA dehydrogenase [Pokkaliibacter plantistimulans]|uniref:Acyl-CoA dehydrogenase n=1 Tax=Pokkaliibacter plantistimulans TaxID=1635171 RepID=A0ABX5M4G2_9GAMM|nr:acyl-CoA dehydrogenase family protein [Pokkaliibacter plantistimulans]PXF32458.1 acyl-CoA dehydrogenase [Pokkaliibacter plantistimulans]
MDTKAPSLHADTHKVFNVASHLTDYNLYTSDHALQQAVSALAARPDHHQLKLFGAESGSATMISHGFLANEHRPVFHSHDRFGHRVDQVEYHPSYHALMQQAISHELHALPWKHATAGAHIQRAAMIYMQAQVDAGHGCPITMTFASVPVLRQQPFIAQHWLPKILSSQYDPRDLPLASKQGATIGMAMTEKQGGSDVRANTTHAVPVYGGYELVGHKFFMSAPMCDGFLVLAQTGSGLSCFLVPRWRPDGSKNQLFIQRLKNKMGNVSNASSEVEFRGAFGWLVGEEGRGVNTILEMVALTRFDCATASAGGMRQAVVQALHHCGQRMAFGALLIKQPLMQNVLADLLIESEAAMLLAMRLAQVLEQSRDAAEARALFRIGTAIGKFWNCKQVAAHAVEAMECIGGSGVMEDSIMPRLYREAPVNAIWEGSGNVQCLDVLRTMQKAPEALEALLDELRLTEGMDPHYDEALTRLHAQLQHQDNLPYRARMLVEQMARLWQASLLLRYGDKSVTEGYLLSRLNGECHTQYGTLPEGVDVQAIIQRGKV